MQKMSFYKLVAINTIEPQNSLSAILVQKNNAIKVDSRKGWRTNGTFVAPYRNHIEYDALRSVGRLLWTSDYTRWTIIFYVTQRRSLRSFVCDAVLGLTVVVTW